MTFNRKWKRGGLSLEMLGVLMIIGLLAGYAARQGTQTRETALAAALADQLNMAAKGAQSYLDANAVALTKFFTENRDESGDYGVNHIKVTKDGVIDSNGRKPKLASGDFEFKSLREYLPVTFKQTRYGQDLALYIYPGDSGSVAGVIATSGGVPEQDKTSIWSDAINGKGHKKKRDYMSVARAAATINGFGMAQTARGKSGIIGQDDAWELPFGDPDFGDLPVMPEGQMARILYAHGGGIKDEVLYRTEIDGHPELNQMETTLWMAGHQITNVGTIEISQSPQTTSGTSSEVDSGKGNGLILDPLPNEWVGGGTWQSVANKAQDVCSQRNRDGYMFTMGTSVSDLYQHEDDMSGIWVCMKGKARLVGDSGNSNLAKGSVQAQNGTVINAPACPHGTVPAIYVAQAAWAGNHLESGEQMTDPAGAVQVYAESLGGSPVTKGWTVKIRIKTTRNKDGEDWVEPEKDSPYNFVDVRTSCERLGQRTADAGT